MQKISINKFAELLNEQTNSLPQYTVIIRDGLTVISNVPATLYECNLLEYQLISEINDAGFDALKDYINQAKIAFRCFNDNECVPNAYNLFELVQETGLFEKNQINFGYISYEIPEIINFMGKDINLESPIIINDWHAYNIVNGLLVDVSIYKDFQYPGQSLVVSGNADEYIYITPPTHLSYYGMSFNSVEDYQTCYERITGLKMK